MTHATGMSLELRSESTASENAVPSMTSMPRSESEPTLSQLRRRSSPRGLTCCTSSQAARQRGLSSAKAVSSANTLHSTKSAGAGHDKRWRGATRRTSSALARASAQPTRTLSAEQNMISPRSDAFAYFDRDGDGFISAKDLVTGLALMGHELTLAEAVEMIAEAEGREADKDGKVTVDNLKSLLAAYGVDC